MEQEYQLYLTHSVHSVSSVYNIATSSNKLSESWEAVPDLEDGFFEDTQATSFYAQKKIYIQGWMKYRDNVGSSTFRVSDASANTSILLPDYPNNINGTIVNDLTGVGGTVEYIPSINKLVFFGGETITVTNQTVIMNNNTYTSSQYDESRYFFLFRFYNLTTFDPETNNKTYSYYGQTSVFVSSRSMIYYFGGGIRSRSNVTDRVGLGYNQFTSAVIEFYLVVPDNKTVLLYGSDSGESFREFSCRLLDMDSMDWTSCNVDMPLSVIARRFLHSAVLVGYYPFILFENDLGGVWLSDMIILDVSDTSRKKYVKNYYYGEKARLGGGTIAGIVIGCVVALS
ncbi:hypothetical protein BDB01DRAFT_839152 [Pilobolus umbonatus]|nr:hypothetical protein BDB01DRAFT_839152 [Pilobolus umbonatus]